MVNQVDKNQTIPLDALNPSIYPLTDQLIGQSYLDSKATTHQQNSKEVATVAGCALGILTGGAFAFGGPAVAIHEVVGHGYLGLGLLNKPESNHTIKYHISPTSGYCSYQSNPNAFARKIGPDYTEAWLSLSGSIPGLILSSCGVFAGMQLRKKSPLLGGMLLTASSIDHLAASTYPITAAAMSVDQMKSEAATGHDFASFALSIGKATKTSAKTVAVSTAILYSGFLPAIAVIGYLYEKTNETDMVTDSQGLRQWLKKVPTDPKAAKEFQKLYKAFIATQNKEAFTKPIEVQQDKFLCYLMENVSKKAMRRSKREVLKNWQKGSVQNKTEKILSIASITGIVATVAGKVMAFLSQSIVPSLSLTSKIFSYLTPAFAAVSVISSAYELKKDLSASDLIIPKKAKMISVAKLVFTVVSSVITVVAVFVPGLNMVFMAVLIAAGAANLGLEYYRSSIVKKRFQVRQAIDPEVMAMMKVIDKDTQSKGIINVSKNLKIWRKNVKEAQKIGLLKAEDLAA